MRGVIFGTAGLEVRDDIELRAPSPNEVLVALQAAGVCHSDLKLLTGATRYPLPVVMGHEGAGVVEAVGPAVSSVQPGDRVVVHTLRSCGRCRRCAAGRPTVCEAAAVPVATPFVVDDGPVHQFANTSVFVERTVVDAAQVVRIDPAIDPAAAALLSCSVLTGAGAVFNRARVTLGDSVVVIGVGGVGLNAIQASRIAGAGRVIAVDSNPGKASIAGAFGASEFVTADDIGEAVRDLVPGGVDHVIICIGRAELVPVAVDLLAPGGTVVLVGFPGGQTEASFTMAAMYQDKAILGCRYGSSSPHRDIPQLARLYLEGRLKLDELITCRRPLAEAAAAFDDLAAGATNGRTVLTFERRGASTANRTAV